MSVPGKNVLMTCQIGQTSFSVNQSDAINHLNL